MFFYKDRFGIRLSMKVDMPLNNEAKLNLFTSYLPMLNSITHVLLGGARGVMVIVVGIAHGDTSSNPGRDWLYFT